MGDDVHSQFLELHMAHQGALFSYLLAATHDFQKAEDLLQDVSLVLWKKFALLKEGGSYLSWALGIARREVARNLRDASRRKTILSMEILENLAGAIDEHQPVLRRQRQALQGCVEKLEPHSREALSLRYQTGMSLKEVAHKLARTPAAVNTMFVRMRRVLMDCTERVLAGGE